MSSATPRHTASATSCAMSRAGAPTRAATLRQDVGEYLQEESRALPSRYEVEAFRKRVQRCATTWSALPRPPRPPGAERRQGR
ncbi:MAG: hypothetical protein U5K76_08930 [Woeseiaceae bacterium]|nr:hypothetical protein [Woeseiaceae bacterium]